MVRFIFLLVLIPIFCSCQNSEELIQKDLPIEIINTDTTFLEVGNIQATSGKFKLTSSGKTLMIHQGVSVFWFDMKEKRIVNSLDLDTTSIMPETTLLNVDYKENDSTLILFFPSKRKIIEVDKALRIKSEVELEDPNDYDQRFIPYGAVFYKNENDSSFFIGIMSNLGIVENTKEFIRDSRFIGKFNAKDGRLIKLFAGFSEARKEDPIHALSEGLFTVDFKNDTFFVRESIASNTIIFFDLEGENISSIEVGTNHMDFDLIEDKGGMLDDFYANDNFYTLKALNDTLFGSNMIEWTHISPEDHQNKGFLLIEDIKNQKSYSTEIYIFQRLVGGDAHHLYFIMNHPTKEDLVLVTLEYALPE